MDGHDHWDEKFERVLRDNLAFLEDHQRLHPDDDLLLLGLKSIRMFSLMVTLEDEYGITFPDELLTAETFATPATIWSAVLQLRQARASEQNG